MVKIEVELVASKLLLSFSDWMILIHILEISICIGWIPIYSFCRWAKCFENRGGIGGIQINCIFQWSNNANKYIGNQR